MNHRKLRTLLKAYREGKTSAEENDKLENWYLSAGQKAEDLPGEIDYIATEQRIWTSLTLQHQVEIKPVVRRIWPRIAVAAAAVATITFGIWFYNFINTSRQAELFSGSHYANDVAPGRNKATLTLPDGKTINLSGTKNGVVIGDDLSYTDGTIIQKDSTLLQKNKSTSILTASTPRGGTYQVTLPDGTKVWLNAASTLKFPSTFSGLVNRKIELTGEAYFEVSKNKKQPFVVQSRKMEITVLGTHFNINDYDDEPNTKATLLEGSVKVKAINLQSTSPLFNSQTILQPDQEAIISGSSELTVAAASVEETMAWKNGKFIFKDEMLGAIMKRIARWYDVQVIYQGAVSATRFSGTISRFENISKVTNILQATEKVRFRIEGRKIYVTPHN